jgi:hypothetical protein
MTKREINFGEIFGTLNATRNTLSLVPDAERCQINELHRTFTCGNRATETLAINPSGWNGVEYAYHEEIEICAQCAADIQ